MTKNYTLNEDEFRKLRDVFAKMFQFVKFMNFIIQPTDGTPSPRATATMTKAYEMNTEMKELLRTLKDSEKEESRIIT